MKKQLSLLVIIILITCFGIGTFAQKPVKYIKLNETELKKIGFVINHEGIFFKSVAKKEKGELKDHIAGFFNDFSTYGTAYDDYFGFFQPDTSETNSYTSKAYEKIKPLDNGYYILVVADMTGHRYFDFYKKDVKVIPVFLDQSLYNFKDTKELIIYFNYTPELAKLIAVKNINDYVTTLKPDEK